MYIMFHQYRKTSKFTRWVLIFIKLPYSNFEEINMYNISTVTKSLLSGAVLSLALLSTNVLAGPGKPE